MLDGFTNLILCSTNLPDKVAIALDVQMDDGTSGFRRGTRPSYSPALSSLATRQTLASYRGDRHQRLIRSAASSKQIRAKEWSASRCWLVQLTRISSPLQGHLRFRLVEASAQRYRFYLDNGNFKIARAAVTVLCSASML